MKDDDSRIDIFLKQVGKMLRLTRGIIKRAKLYQSYGKLDVSLVSNEDIFLFKSMSSRSGDIEDCDRLIQEELDYGIIYDEIIEQSKQGRKCHY